MMPPLTLDTDAAIARFLTLVAIPGRSGDEKTVSEAIVDQLLDAGLDPDCITHDDAHTRTRIKGNTGNLFVNLPGDDSLPRTLLSAHMDTVPICLGCDPVRRADPVLGDVVVAAGETGLGGDDRAGCVVILTAILERLRRQAEQPEVSFPPAVISFLIQEEVGLEGARHLSVDKIGRVDRGFNFDGGTMETIRHGAIGGERMTITVRGHASHAGVAPEKGVSAIVIAARAIARLHEQGWLGKVQRDGGVGTANVGVIQGGDATNVVTPEVQLRAEARSHDAGFRTKIVAAIRDAFESSAAEVTDVRSRCGMIEFASNVDYESFALTLDHPSVAVATSALTQMGYQPVCELANGGLDANWLYRHGIEAVTLGCGQAAIHTVDEHLLVDHFLDACRLATGLITTL